MENNVVDVNLLNQIIWNERNAANENFDNEMDDDEDRDGDGTLDGGVARSSDETSTSDRKSSSDCDLVRSPHVAPGRLSTCYENSHASPIFFFLWLDVLFGL